MDSKQKINERMGIYYSQHEIMELVGAENWQWVDESFGGMLPNSIKAELDTMYPGEDNEYLAVSIYDRLND